MKSNPRKRVTNDVLQSFPVPQDNQHIVRVQDLRGNNTCEVVYPDDTKGIAEIPGKFKKVIWIGKGDFLIVDSFRVIQKAQAQATVIHILQKEQIHHLKKIGLWPAQFLELKSQPTKKGGLGDYDYKSDDESEEFVNPNHVGVDGDEDDDDEYSF